MAFFPETDASKHGVFPLVTLYRNLPRREHQVLADSDKSVLLRFKEAVSDPSSVLASWVMESEDYCSWFGVSCDSTSRVMALNMSGSASDKGSSQISRNRFTCADIGKFPLYGFGIRRAYAGNRGTLVGNLPSVIVGLTELRVMIRRREEDGISLLIFWLEFWFGL